MLFTYGYISFCSLHLQNVEHAQSDEQLTHGKRVEDNSRLLHISRLFLLPPFSNLSNLGEEMPTTLAGLVVEYGSTSDKSSSELYCLLYLIFEIKIKTEKT
jgi:hypothetical protein